MVRKPCTEASTLSVLFNSGIKTLFFWRFKYFRTLPVGLNLVARVRLEYPPPTVEPFLVITHIFIPYEIGRVRLRFVVLSIIYNIFDQFHNFVYFMRPRFRSGFISLKNMLS